MRGETSDTHMDKPCEVCGGVGFEYCIVACSQCRTTREHIFCMKKNLMEVPDVWICEACTSTGNVVSPKSGGEEKFLDLFGVVHHEVMHPGTPGKVCADPGWQLNSKKPKMETGKVKFLSTEEAIRLSSGTLKIGFRGRNNIGLKYDPSSSIEIMSRRTSIPSKIVTPKFSIPGVKASPNVTSSAFMKPPTHAGAEINKMLSQHAIRTSKESKASKQRCDKNCGEECGGMYRASTTSMHSVPLKEVEASNRKIEKALNNTSPLMFSPTTSSGKTFHVVAEPADFAVKEPDFLNFLSKVEPYRLYRPALEVTWMGGFKFFDTDSVGRFYGGFLAQPPRTVHRKVFEFSKKLPKILQVKLLPQAHLSADLFGNDSPEFHDIALYFFPSAYIERSKWNNSCLFELLEIRNSVMSCYVDDVELLIFTSKQLHVDSQRVIARLDRKCFLWGVFRDVKADHILHESHKELPSLVLTMDCVCDDHATMVNLEATDMDIDMEGRRIVGPVEVVVSKELSRRACGGHDKGDVTSVTEKMLLEPKHGRCTSSDKSFGEIKCKISSEHTLSKGKLANAKVDADSPLGFEKIPRLNSRTIEEKVGGVDGGVINHVKKENIGLQGLSGAPFGASSAQLRRSSDDSKLTKSKKHHQEPGRDEAYDPLASFSSPLSEKCNQRGLEIKAEVNDDENPLRTWKKRDLEVEAKRKINTTVCWMPPPKNWVKLNIEGSSSGILGSAGAGGTIRDESGKWILGYSKNLGTSTSLASELWALFLGLKLVCERGFRKVLVEYVSYEAVKCLQQPTAFLDPNRALILGCIDLLHRNRDCKLQRAHREANLCANWLATHCENQPLGALAVFDTTPSALVPIFQKDYTGIAQTHSY